MARIRSPAHAPAMDPAWQRCRWQRGRDFALEPKLTALAMRIFGAERRYEQLMRSSLETCTMLDRTRRHSGQQKRPFPTSLKMLPKHRTGPETLLSILNSFKLFRIFSAKI